MSAPIDDEVDLHGLSEPDARFTLDTIWASRKWLGLRRVRVIHGMGAVLWKAVRDWCAEKGIEWTTDRNNQGATILLPGRRLQSPAPPPHRPLRSLPWPEKPKANPKRPDPPIVPALPQRPPARQPTADDLFSAEVERLCSMDEAAVRRRKHGG